MALILRKSTKHHRVISTRKNKKNIKPNKYNHIRDYSLDCLEHNISAQSYGPGVEKILIKKLNWHKDKRKNTGDAVTANGDMVEIKFSIANMKGETNYVQIRPHYKANLYLLIYYSPELDKLEAFLLKKNYVKLAIYKFGGYAHGSIKTQGKITLKNIFNNSYEYAIRPNVIKNDAAIKYFRKYNLLNKEEYKWMKKTILS